ncbi:MAG TPA: AraC family transcriptional regulator [Rhizomicrobium sp.]|jgi:AraC-like DNA-binding protein
MAAILSELLNAVRVVRSDWAILELGYSARLRLPRDKRAYVHFVLEGTALLEGAGVEGGAAALAAGSYAIVLDGKAHAIGHGPKGALTDTHYFQDDHTLCSPPMLRFGSGAPAARVLSGTLEISRASGDLLRRGLPGLLLNMRDGGALELDPQGLERSAMGAGGMAFLNVVADMLLVQAVRGAIVQVSPSENAAADIFSAPQIGTALRLIDTQPEKNWSVSLLAGEVGMSRSVFAAAFRQSVGEPPMQYITSVRIARSGQLLKSSTMPVVKVAQQVGYGSVSSFARAFKRHHGATPGAFRRSTRGANHRFRPAALQLDPFLS